MSVSVFNNYKCNQEYKHHIKRNKTHFFVLKLTSFYICLSDNHPGLFSD